MNKHNIDELELYHHELDEKIKIGYTNYIDDKELSKMKMEKAHVKRQIEQLRNHQ